MNRTIPLLAILTLALVGCEQPGEFDQPAGQPQGAASPPAVAALSQDPQMQSADPAVDADQ